jgi:hypothetical protein
MRLHLPCAGRLTRRPPGPRRPCPGGSRQDCRLAAADAPQIPSRARFNRPTPPAAQSRASLNRLRPLCEVQNWG